MKKREEWKVCLWISFEMGLTSQVSVSRITPLVSKCFTADDSLHSSKFEANRFVNHLGHTCSRGGHLKGQGPMSFCENVLIGTMHEINHHASSCFSHTVCPIMNLLSKVLPKKEPKWKEKHVEVKRRIAKVVSPPLHWTYDLAKLLRITEHITQRTDISIERPPFLIPLPFFFGKF